MSARLAVERLCALIWKPHVNTIHDHGIFAPSAAWRAQKEKAALGQVVPPDAPRWTPWLVLLSRVFEQTWAAVQAVVRRAEPTTLFLGQERRSGSCCCWG